MCTFLLRALGNPGQSKRQGVQVRATRGIKETNKDADRLMDLERQK